MRIQHGHHASSCPHTFCLACRLRFRHPRKRRSNVRRTAVIATDAATAPVLLVTKASISTRITDIETGCVVQVSFGHLQCVCCWCIHPYCWTTQVEHCGSSIACAAIMCACELKSQLHKIGGVCLLRPLPQAGLQSGGVRPASDIPRMLDAGD